MAQPFLVTGCNFVVVSYWNIDDRCAVDLVAEFYQLLRDENSKSGSLALAKRSMLHADRELYHHPYFWAPFVLIGLAD